MITLWIKCVLILGIKEMLPLWHLCPKSLLTFFDIVCWDNIISEEVGLWFLLKREKCQRVQKLLIAFVKLRNRDYYDFYLLGYLCPIKFEMGELFQMNLDWGERRCNTVHVVAQLLVLEILIELN